MQEVHSAKCYSRVRRVNKPRTSPYDDGESGMENARRPMSLQKALRTSEVGECTSPDVKVRGRSHVARCHVDISILVFTSNYKIQVLTSSTITNLV